MEEKTLTISMKKLTDKPRPHRAAKAVRHVKRQLKKNFRINENSIKLSMKINELLWERGIGKVPRKIEVKALMEDGFLRAFLKGEKIEKKKEPEKEKKDTEDKKDAEKEKEIEEKKKEKKQKEKAAEKAAIKRHTA